MIFIHFDVLVEGNNIGANWIASDVNSTIGDYNSIVTFGPYPISSGNQNFIIADALDPNCFATIIVQAPNSCSTLCSISHIVSNIRCQNLGHAP